MDDLQEIVIPFIEESLENIPLKNVKINVTGQSEKGEGYIGDIAFVTLTGLNELNEEKELYLVLKMGKRSKTTRETFDVRRVCLREIYVYDKVFPVFKKFQQYRGTKIFDVVPKCYKTIVQDDVEVLVLENLKKRGFELNDCQIPMNDRHILYILNKYALFHATSFAMREQDKIAFEKLTANYDNMHKRIMLTDNMKSFISGRFERMREVIKETDQELEKLLVKVFEKGSAEKLAEVINADVEEFVIVHGDCWNNNFMFKYEVSSLFVCFIKAKKRLFKHIFLLFIICSRFDLTKLPYNA